MCRNLFNRRWARLSLLDNNILEDTQSFRDHSGSSTLPRTRMIHKLALLDLEYYKQPLVDKQRKHLHLTAGFDRCKFRSGMEPTCESLSGNSSQPHMEVW